MGGHLCKERWASLTLVNLEKTLMGRALVVAVNGTEMNRRNNTVA